MFYMFFADGFEEVEAIAALDVIRRAGIKAESVGIGSREITGAHGIIIPKRRSVTLSYTVAKTSAGAIEYVPVAKVGNLNSEIEKTTSFLYVYKCKNNNINR